MQNGPRADPLTGVWRSMMMPLQSKAAATLMPCSAETAMPSNVNDTCCSGLIFSSGLNMKAIFAEMGYIGSNTTLKYPVGYEARMGGR